MRIGSVKIVKVDGEYIVRAYDLKGKRYPAADHFADSKEDAEATAKVMVTRNYFTEAAAVAHVIFARLNAEEDTPEQWQAIAQQAKELQTLAKKQVQRLAKS